MSDGPIRCHGVTYLSIKALAEAYGADDISLRVSIRAMGRTPEEAVAGHRLRPAPRPIRLDGKIYPSLEEAVSELAREQGWTREKARLHIKRRLPEAGG